MTREQKLALIVGFALVLFVGVLISDHFSSAHGALGDGGEVAALDQSLAPDLQVGFGRPMDEVHAAPERAPEATANTRRFPQTDPGLAANARDAKPAEPRLANAESDEDRGLDRIFDGLRDVAQGLGETLQQSQQNPVAAQRDTAPGSLVMGRPATPTRTERPAGAAPSGAADDRAAWPVHRIRSGESLWSISRDHYGDGHLHKKLAEANEGRVGPGGSLRVGGSILLPPPSYFGLGQPQVAARAPRQDPAPRRDADPNEYTVRPGDTLGEIAQRELGTTRRMREIIELNAGVIDDEDSIRVGMILRLPGA